MSSSYFDFIEIDQRLQHVFDLAFNQKTRGTLSGLLKNLLVEKKEINLSKQETSNQKEVANYLDAGKTYYRLTEKGYTSLCLEFPFFRYVKDQWDGAWRIISYEIPEVKRELRDKLRREMRGWGLGPWHRSFWITPHPIIGTLRDRVFGKQEEKYVQAFESTHVFGNLGELVEKVWQKSKLEKKYRELFKKWHDILTTEKRNEYKMQEVLSHYVDILREDPGLPQVIVGRRWIGFEAISIFKQIKNILLK